MSPVMIALPRSWQEQFNPTKRVGVFMTNEKNRRLEQLYKRYDRLTAYGCAMRNAEFNPTTMNEAWEEYRREWNDPEGWNLTTKELTNV